MKLAGYGLHSFDIMKHGVMDGLVDGLLQGWPKICWQALQNLVRTQKSGFVEETLVEHGVTLAHPRTKRKRSYCLRRRRASPKFRGEGPRVGQDAAAWEAAKVARRRKSGE